MYFHDFNQGNLEINIINTYNFSDLDPSAPDFPIPKGPQGMPVT